MLSKISAENFKSWKSLKPLEIGRVTLLFGENSSGKSSLIQLLLLIKQTAESYDRAQPLHLGSNDSLVELGLFEDIIYQHNKKLELKIHLEWFAKSNKLSNTKEFYVLDYEDEIATFDVEFKYITDMIRVTRLRLQLNDGSFDIQQNSEHIHNAELTRSSRGGYELSINGQMVEELRSSRDLAPIKCYGFPSKAASMYPGLNELSFAVEKLAKQIHYIGPLRESSKRDYSWSGSSPGVLGRNGENAIQAILANMIERRSLKRAEKDNMPSLAESTDKWLRKMGLVDSFNIKSDGGKIYKAVVKVPGHETEVNVADVGVGVSQVLPIVVLAYFVPEESIIILEQPELHLHPSVQAMLAEFFFDVAKERNIQFIVETHSEHLLTHLQRKVAERKEGELTEKEVMLYVCKRNKGTSDIVPLEMDDTGRILNWPPQFFGDTVSDKEAVMKAIIRKKKLLQERDVKPLNE